MKNNRLLIRKCTAGMLSAFVLCRTVVLPPKNADISFVEEITAAASDFTADDAINYCKSVETYTIDNGQCVGFIDMPNKACRSATNVV